MTHDRVATFWTAMLWHVLKIWYARLKAYKKQQAKRYVDRYYRIGRHRPTTVGYQNLRWATHLVAELREDRQLHHHQMPV